MIRPSAIQLAHLFHRNTKSGEGISLIAVAIIATEMRFRPCYFRWGEYALLFWMLLAGKRPQLSVGIAQLSFRHWNFDDPTKVLGVMSTVMNVHKNYRNVEHYLSGTKSIKAALNLYNTKTSKIYFEEFSRNFEILRNSKCAFKLHNN